MKTIKVKIKTCYSDAVMFAADIDASIEESMRLKAALTLAVTSDANLCDANLRGANLRGANLGGANLGGANLGGAKVDSFTLIGTRPILQIGPLGSRNDYLIAFLTKQGIRIRAGCFTGTLAEFSEVVKGHHGDNEHGREYVAAIAMIESHAAIWIPVVEEAKAAA